jgi:hypothetical protein
MADALRAALGCWGGVGNGVSARLLRSIQKKPGSSTAAAAAAAAAAAMTATEAVSKSGVAVLADHEIAAAALQGSNMTVSCIVHTAHWLSV